MKRFGLMLLATTFAAPLAAQDDTRSPWLEWVKQNSPYGFDITPDGTIWINVQKPGLQDDYAIRAGDLQAARETKSRYPQFWIRGYHLRNPKVPYRETKTKYQLNCAEETIRTLVSATYSKDGTAQTSEAYSSPTTIVPGTYGAEYHRLFCLVG